MDDLLRQGSTLQGTIAKNMIQEFSENLKKDDKIQNILTIHHYGERNRSLEIDMKSNSVSTVQFSENKKVHKTFLFDSVSAKDGACDDVLSSAIKRVAEKEDSFILSVSRGLQKKSRNTNIKLLETLINWLLQYLESNDNNGRNMYSLRLSGLEINEEMDTFRQLGTEGLEDRRVTLENQYGHRFTDVKTAADVISQLQPNSEHNDQGRDHYLYTIHLYHHETLCSNAKAVSSQCSRIFFLLMDLTKQKTGDNYLSPPGLAKFLLASLNRDFDKLDIQSNLQSILFDLTRNFGRNFSMITQISMRERHLSDTYQLLQLASRIQRLKVKSKKYFENRKVGRPNRPITNFGAYCKEDKYSDTEIVSTSELSCAETAIFIGEEHRGNSDDESRRFRSLFMSSDSDSGYRELKACHSGENRGTTTFNENRKQTHHRTTDLAWPKSAMRMAKAALMNGEELWVDGPNALDNSEDGTPSMNALNKHLLSSCLQNTKPIMVSQETQCEEQNSAKEKKATEDIHQLSDIREVMEENDTLKNVKCYDQDPIYPKQPPNMQDNSPLQRNDVQNLSNWIQEVNELTSYHEFLTNSQNESLIQNKKLFPIRNESPNNQRMQYFDSGIEAAYNSFPRTFHPMQYTTDSTCNPLSVRCYNMTPDSDRELLSPSAEKPSNRFFKKNDTIESNPNDSYSKSKSFSPLGLLKKTLMRKKKKEVTEHVSEPQNYASPCPDLMYLRPVGHNHEESSNSTSSDSECNEWFRKVKTFKSKAEYVKNKCTEIRPPSAPLLAGSSITTRPQYSCRQRSSSSGYGSVVTRGSEMSSHHDSTSDQSIYVTTNNTMKQSISFSHPTQNSMIHDDLDPETNIKCYELLVKQEKALLLIQQQEMMIQEFYTETRPLLTNDNYKYSLRVSAFDLNRVTPNNDYLEELEEDTNIIRDSIAFYKSLVRLESSFLTSPDISKRNFH